MRRALTILVAAAALLAGWVAACLYLPYQKFSSQGVFVDVPHGASRRAVARLLANQGVVRSRWVFEALSRWRSRSTLQAGEYFFHQPVTSFQVFDTIANGRVYVRELVIPEGFSMFDIADLVQRENFTSREDFLSAARNPALIRDLVPGAPSLEGFLFPASYEFPRHPTGEQLVAAGRLDGASLPFDSPYNTYRHTGLPPGPIANPGNASLKAALDPHETDYLYFVANTEGGHFFGKTLAEHNRNVALYRSRLAALRNAAPASASTTPLGTDSISSPPQRLR
ncbi:MAG: hypothetical protein DMG32_04120 [Acidobacteria bacterium]|nr:MAG: hypothetical protein DMG32_04120 [Acidobacteriota bacterium]